STGQRVLPPFDSQSSVCVPRLVLDVVIPPMENSARQPLSTQIPRWLMPHGFPRMHSLSLRVRTSVTPPRTLVWHWCRVLLSDSQTTSVSFVVVVTGVLLERFSVTRKSARHPRSTQITLLRKPHVCPCTQL